MAHFSQQAPPYREMQDIQARKMQLLKEIHQDSMKIERLRHELFKKETQKKRKGMRMSMSNVVKTGTGVLDGLLLAWKLYKKFKK